jgi:hypothetical protein
VSLFAWARAFVLEVMISTLSDDGKLGPKRGSGVREKKRSGPSTGSNLVLSFLSVAARLEPNTDYLSSWVTRTSGSLEKTPTFAKRMQIWTT